MGLPPLELQPSNPREVEEATPADSSCQRREPRTEDGRWRGEKREEPGKERRWMTRGCRCELSWETNVQRLRGVKRRR